MIADGVVPPDEAPDDEDDDGFQQVNPGQPPLHEHQLQHPNHYVNRRVLQALRDREDLHTCEKFPCLRIKCPSR